MSEEKKNSLDAEELAGVAGGDEPGVSDAPDPEINGLIKCPKCGSTDTYVDIKAMVYYCRTCGYKW